MKRIRFDPGVCIAVCLAVLTIAQAATAPAAELSVKVIKACPNCVLPAAPQACTSASMHWDRAGAWTPTKTVRIHAVSIPEQAEIAIYTDIEVSTAREMYLLNGHIFRAKYAGPGVLRDPACEVSFLGSNVTTTNIVFPAGYWIKVPAGTPVYVHMDVKNWSPYRIDHMTQDVYVYYTEVAN